MKVILKLFGLLMFFVGISLLIYPEFIIGGIEKNLGNTSLYISAIGVRLVIGVLFILAAKGSRYPRTFKILGFVFILASIILLFIGQGGFQHLITSLIPQVKPYAPISGILSMAFGGFVIFAFLKNKELASK